MEAGLPSESCWRPPSARAVARCPPTLPQPVSRAPRPTWLHLFLPNLGLSPSTGSWASGRAGPAHNPPWTESSSQVSPLRVAWDGELGSRVLMERNHGGRPRRARHPWRCGDAPGTLRPRPPTHVPPSQKPHPHHTTPAPEGRPWTPAVATRPLSLPSSKIPGSFHQPPESVPMTSSKPS